jgi:outer membrane protein OmpA-like peptidoglycan-associated protein
MKANPEIEVEVSAHTDCHGTDAYNLLLSQRRANAVKAYLVGNGISAKRIKAVGYGKTHLLNHCDCSRGVYCTEEEDEFNRRAEYKITKQ